MAMRPSYDPRGVGTQYIDDRIGAAYANVETVANRIAEVNYVTANMQAISSFADAWERGTAAKYRFDWAPATEYEALDIIRDGEAGNNTGLTYIALEAHTSTASFADDLADTKWESYLGVAAQNYAATPYFFEADGARVHKLPDRLHLGATSNDASTLGGGVDADWFSEGTGVSAGLAWVSYLSTSMLVSANGTVGYAAASRASDVDAGLGTYQISIPFVGIAIMDRTGSGPPYWTSYGAYLEARIEEVSAAIGTAIGLEIDAVNFGDLQSEPTPWRAQTLGGAASLWLASGGDPANHGRAINPAQLALGIINNGETFQAGIIIRNDAIEGTDGTTGFGAAINLSTRHILGWYAEGAGNGERVSYITSTNTVPGHSLQFQDNSTFFLNADGTNIDFGVGNVENSVNGIGVVPAIAGQHPYIESFGSDANPNVDIKPKGSGNLRLFAETLLFMANDGNQLAYINCDITDNDFETGLVFTDGGPIFYSKGKTIIGFGNVVNGVNNIAFTNAVAGQHPEIKTEGDDAHPNLMIRPKGDGHLGLAAQYLMFYSDGGNQMAYVENAVNDTAYLNGMAFTNFGPSFYGLGATIFSLFQQPSAVAYLQISNAAVSDPILVETVGSSNVDIHLNPSGTLMLGVPSATSATAGGASALPGDPAGYFTLKDAGGTPALVPYWNL